MYCQAKASCAKTARCSAPRLSAGSEPRLVQASSWLLGGLARRNSAETFQFDLDRTPTTPRKIKSACDSTLICWHLPEIILHNPLKSGSVLARVLVYTSEVLSLIPVIAILFSEKPAAANAAMLAEHAAKYLEFRKRRGGCGCGPLAWRLRHATWPAVLSAGIEIRAERAPPLVAGLSIFPRCCNWPLSQLL